VADLHELAIDGVSVNGDGVGRLADGRVVFVPGAVPGDTVRVRLATAKKRVQSAELLSFVTHSSERVERRCIAQHCGNCPLGDLSMEAQARVKRQRVVEALARVGHIEVDELLGEVRHAPDGWRTRHRVRLHSVWRDGAFRLGFFEPHTHTLGPIGPCAALWPELEDAVHVAARLVTDLPAEAQLADVEIAYSRRDARAAARLYGHGPIAAYKHWLTEVPSSSIAGVIVEVDGHTWRYGNVELRYDHAHAEQFDLRFEPGVFTQANPAMNDELVAAVVRSVRAGEKKRVLELHAGIGNFSVPVRLAGIDLVATERHPRSTVLCRRNARGAGVSLDVLDTSDEKAVSTLGAYDAVLLDPPRAGAKAAVQLIAAASSVQRVLYVSCDPATLARDAAILVQGGFHVTSAEAFDMFPETPHVETLLVLSR